jgi:hypothetical protein
MIGSVRSPVHSALLNIQWKHKPTTRFPRSTGMDVSSQIEFQRPNTFSSVVPDYRNCLVLIYFCQASLSPSFRLSVVGMQSHTLSHPPHVVVDMSTISLHSMGSGVLNPSNTLLWASLLTSLIRISLVFMQASTATDSPTGCRIRLFASWVCVNVCKLHVYITPRCCHWHRMTRFCAEK